MKLISAYMQTPKSHTCKRSNGGCSHLCLQKPGGSSHQCACPNEFKLNSDQRTCTALCVNTQFRCGHGDDKCIPLTWKCDGEADCKNRADEPASCPPTNCRTGQVMCRNGNCISPSTICDTYDDCGDRSDETNCTERQCSSSQFRCRSGQCISLYGQCDSEIDCKDRSDEEYRACRSKKCFVNEFKCDSGQCIPQQKVCDLHHDCPDLSDEASMCKYRTTFRSIHSTRRKSETKQKAIVMTPSAPRMTKDTLKTTKQAKNSDNFGSGNLENPEEEEEDGNGVTVTIVVVVCVCTIFAVVVMLCCLRHRDTKCHRTVRNDHLNSSNNYRHLLIFALRRTRDN